MSLSGKVNNRILVVDDNPAIHADIRKVLGVRDSSEDSMTRELALLLDETPPTPAPTLEFEIESAYQGQEGLAKVDQAKAEGRPFAVAFVDVRMPPGWDGVETIHRIWQNHPDLQVVICTAYSDYSWEQMVRKIGRNENLLILKKPFDTIEVIQMAHALTQKWHLNHEVNCRLHNLDQMVSQRTTELQLTNDQLKMANDQLKKEIAERMQMEKALRLSEERFSKAFKASPIPLAIQTLRQEKFIDANDGFLELTGYSRDEMVDRTPQDLNLWELLNDGTSIIKRLHAHMSIRNMPLRVRAKTGQIKETVLSVELFQLEEESFILTILQDITEQVRLENQLRQSQKMEAVGQLAAGVAHDFNNILTIVEGHATMLLASRPVNSPDQKPLETITAATQRAAKLVRQLLTFSRKQFMRPRSLKIDEVLAVVRESLSRVLDESVKVEIENAPSTPTIYADAGMLEQLIMNLALNACDAMPQGGSLKISAQEVHLKDCAGHSSQDAYPGHFLCVNVSDTGTGIPPEILPRIFEPFFTTKPIGRGVGLGLATVYGIAKQHGGWVEVQTEVGKGSTFTLFIPARKGLHNRGKASETHSDHASDGGPSTIPGQA